MAWPYNCTFTFIERVPRPVNVVRPAPLRFQIPTGGPTTRTAPGALSMTVECLQGAPPLVEPLTHTKLLSQVLGSLHGGGLVCPLQSLLLAVLYTRCCGVGWFFLPRGKGLKKYSPAIELFPIYNVKKIAVGIFTSYPCWKHDCDVILRS